MALRIIRKDDDEILRKKSREVTVFDNRLFELLDDMFETMQDANGVGLSAVQVGVLRRVVVIDAGEGRIELINPAITERSVELVSAAEGCLSFPGEWGIVDRPKRVTVRAQDRGGNPIELVGEDLLARAICHEVDHLDGVLFQDLAKEMVDEDSIPDEDA